jgi:hypothetical protein
MPEVKGSMRKAAQRRIDWYKSRKEGTPTPNITGKTPPGGDKKKQEGRAL